MRIIETCSMIVHESAGYRRSGDESAKGLKTRVQEDLVRRIRRKEEEEEVGDGRAMKLMTCVWEDVVRKRKGEGGWLGGGERRFLKRSA